MKNAFSSLFNIPSSEARRYRAIETPIANKIWSPEYIWHYINLNVTRVCTINNTCDNYWYYSEIDNDIMFSPHTSWVYFITINGYIVKIGETGNPLGIPSKETQPMHGSTNRLGRYRKGDTTDQRIRQELILDFKSKRNKIEFYAIKCGELTVKLPMLGIVSSQIHKALEKKLLDHYKNHTGAYPRLNTGRY